MNRVVMQPMLTAGRGPDGAADRERDAVAAAVPGWRRAAVHHAGAAAARGAPAGAGAAAGRLAARVSHAGRRAAAGDGLLRHVLGGGAGAPPRAPPGRQEGRDAARHTHRHRGWSVVRQTPRDSNPSKIS